MTSTIKERQTALVELAEATEGDEDAKANLYILGEAAGLSAQFLDETLGDEEEEDETE